MDPQNTRSGWGCGGQCWLISNSNGIPISECEEASNALNEQVSDF